MPAWRALSRGEQGVPGNATGDGVSWKRWICLPGAGSSPYHRGFCGHCGSPVSVQRLSRPDHIGIALASLDDPNALPPEAHIWVSSKLDWVRIDDGLPQFLEGAPP